MGTWNISITGTGCHHNYSRGGRPDMKDVDAERLAATFVATLKAAGHTVHEAKFTFTTYPAENVMDSKQESVDETPGKTT